MPEEKVKIELLQPKIYHLHYRLQKGTIHDAWIKEDGTAQLYRYPTVQVNPRHYRIYIPEQDYAKLLASEHNSEGS